MSEYNSKFTEVESLEQILCLQTDALHCNLQGRREDAIKLQREAIRITKGVRETARSMEPNLQLDEEIAALKDAFGEPSFP